MTKTKIGAPSGKRSTHNLSCQSLTTSDLFKTQPIFCREVFKGDKFDIQMLNLNRVDNLPVSSFVAINNRFHWFYVKMTQVWKPFDNFINKVPYCYPDANGEPDSAIPSEVPYFTFADLLMFFYPNLKAGTDSTHYLNNQLFQGITPTEFAVSTRPQEATSDSVITTAINKLNNHTADFVYVYDDNSSSQTNKAVCACLKLTDAGRRLFNILQMLGYRMPQFYMDVADDSIFSTYKNNVGAYSGIRQSALPFMAYLSILMNYFVPTKWRDYSFVNSMAYLKSPIPHVGGIKSPTATPTLYASFRDRVYRLVLNAFYGSDYFTDSLVQPYNMRVSSVLDESPTASTEKMAVVDSPNDGVPAVTNISTGQNLYVDEYILAALKAVSTKAQISALTNNNLLAAALQQFGYKPEQADMIPYLLAQRDDQIVVEPVIATAEGANVPLGYKAGEGVGSANMKCDFDFDDFGFLICVNSITPDYFYADGINREMLHTQPEDFHDPAFVNLGFQPVCKGELFVNPAKNSTNYGSPSDYLMDDTFGFQNKYAEYGYRRDFIGGDFVINSMNNGLDVFHFKRATDGDVNARHINSEQFAVAAYGTAQGVYKNQFDRIFGVVAAGLDHIQQWNYFKILATRSIPSNGEWTVGDDDKNVVEGAGVTDNINN